MNFESIPGVVTAIAVVAGAAVYIWGSIKTKADQVDDDTITRLNNAVNALKVENESLRRENDLLREQLKSMQAQINQSKADITRLTDLATNQTAIAEVKAMLESFKFIIPMVQQFQQNDTDIMHGLKEIREMIRALEKKGKAHG